jgi:hypothetical protein
MMMSVLLCIINWASHVGVLPTPAPAIACSDRIYIEDCLDDSSRMSTADRTVISGPSLSAGEPRP